MPDRLPPSVRTLVIGAGVHGLSTAWHLARQGEEVLVLDKTGVGRGRLGDRLRDRAQQLLPAGDAGADGRLRRGLGGTSPRRSTTTPAATSRSAPPPRRAT